MLTTFGELRRRCVHLSIALALTAAVAGGPAAPPAAAAPGDLGFAGCIGSLAGCTPTNPAGALDAARGLVASADGRHLYAAAYNADAVSHFTVGPTGGLDFAGCIGGSGCAPTNPGGALESVERLAASADGRHLYAAAHVVDAVSHLTIEQPPPAAAGDGALGGTGGAPPGTPRGTTPPAFGPRTLLTLKLAATRIPAKGPLKVRVANANGFEVTGRLSGQTVNRVSVAQKRRIALKAKAYRVAARAARTVSLRLPKALQRVLKRQRRLRLRLAASLTDPAGNTRTVERRVTPKLKRNRRR
jgi:hypothetical protein